MIRFFQIAGYVIGVLMLTAVFLVLVAVGSIVLLMFGTAYAVARAGERRRL